MKKYIKSVHCLFKNIISKLNKLYISETGKYVRLSSNRIYESGVFL